MRQVNITTAAFTEIHAGNSLARTTPPVSITLADSLNPGATAIANSAANTPIYLPVGKAVFAKAILANATLDIIE